MKPSSTPSVVRLKKNISGHIKAGHPWVWRDALEPSRVEPGEVVTVQDEKGRFLARGFADEGAIGVRVFTTLDEPLGAELLALRVTQAAELRRATVPPNTTAYRLLHGEGDRVPGCVCDIYGDIAVVQLDGAAALANRDLFLSAFESTFESLAINTVLVRHGKRGAKEIELHRGTMPNEPITVMEHGMALRADLVHGQKTGLFLDHREWRKRVRDLAPTKRVLNLYSYTGGFSVAAALGGAHATSVDVAASAIEFAKATFEANNIPAAQHDAIAMDAMEYLDRAHKNGERFDFVISDPPSFAPNEESLPQALKSYRALHQACFRVLKKRGLYLAASCSSHVTRALFDETLVDAAAKHGGVLQILERGGGTCDHPRLAAFPEGDYLKVSLTRLLA